MSRTLTASDRKSLIRLAASLPKGSEDRRAILAGLKMSNKNIYVVWQQAAPTEDDISRFEEQKEGPFTDSEAEGLIKRLKKEKGKNRRIKKVNAGLKTSRTEDGRKFESEAKMLSKEITDFLAKIAQWDHEYGFMDEEQAMKKSFTLVSQAQSKLDEAARVFRTLL